MQARTKTASRKPSSPYEVLTMPLGDAPVWYKVGFVAYLVLNVGLLKVYGPYAATGAILIEFISMLALSTKCVPLFPGAALLIQAVLLGLVTPEAIQHEIIGIDIKNGIFGSNISVVLLVFVMTTAVSFHSDLIDFIFMKVVLSVRSSALLAQVFMVLTSGMSAMLDAVTVCVIFLSVCFILIFGYHRFASGKRLQDDHDHMLDTEIRAHHKEDLEQFRSFLRGKLMHAAIGTMLGGCMTMIGEPQNLLIAKRLGWDFGAFFYVTAPVSIPVFVVGLVTCYLVERIRYLDYGVDMPENVRIVLQDNEKDRAERRTARDYARIVVQAVVFCVMSVLLANSVADVYLIGLVALVLIGLLIGVTGEHPIAEAAKESTPFMLLLIVFFGIVALLHAQHLFNPVIDSVMELEGQWRLLGFFGASGLLSMISDNVFVATIFIDEAKRLNEAGVISRQEFEHIAVAINMGTNVPSIATPNGQAAFLLILMFVKVTRAIGLTYWQMMRLAFPYLLTTTPTAMLAIWYLL